MGLGTLPISWIRRPKNTQVLVKTGKCITFQPPIHSFFNIVPPLERSQALVSISGLHLSPTTIYAAKRRFLLDRKKLKILSNCLKQESVFWCPGSYSEFAALAELS